MASDREVLRIIWEGQIPVCFQADPDEIDGVRQPENFYLLVSRLSYLPLVTEKVGAHTVILIVCTFLMTFLICFRLQARKHFARFVTNTVQDGEVWFDCNGIPLKWHFPIGK